ncbi:MAG TPA: hypothetical protein VLG16_02200 [Candidatus Saccharimonadales bacterium]|nr:hypothetical protein [Candidatus Saccharimonadales bacterium]
MNTSAKRQQAVPRRPLRTDFTSVTFQHAKTAKRRATNKLAGDLFAMKKPFHFMRTASGAMLGVAVIAAGSVGVYALTNWFGGNPTVTESASIMHIDLSSCKGNLPAGVEPTDNRQDIQFKITGTPHISAGDLQQQLLTDCEFNAVNDFYNPGKTYESQYSILPAIVTSVHGNTFAVSYQSVQQQQPASKTFTVTPDTVLYDQGNAANTSDFKPGNTIVITTATAAMPHLETEDPWAGAPVHSVFKTKYDLSKASGVSKSSGLNYEADHIVPVDTLRQAHP